MAQIFRVTVQVNAPPPAPAPIATRVLESGPGDPDGANGAGSRGSQPKRRAVTAAVGAADGGGGAAAAKIGRNDPCWCGSGKKYKRCHGR